MGKEIVYCAECGKRLHQDDFDRGRASLTDNRPYCNECRGVESPPPRKATPPPLPVPTPPPGRISSTRLPVLPPSTTRRRGAPRAGARRALYFGIGGGVAVLAFLGALLSRPSEGGAPPPAATPAPVRPPVAVPAPAPSGDRGGQALRAVAELEALEARGADAAVLLERCERARETVLGTPYEARLRDLEARLLEQKREREREQQVTRAIDDARKILGGANAIDRKADVLALLRALRSIAGPRLPEVDRLIHEAERLREEPEVVPPPAAAVPDPTPVARPEPPGPEAVPLEVTGLVTRWLILGPFGNRAEPRGADDHDLLGGEAQYVPEPGAEVVTREGSRVRWTPVAVPSGTLLFSEQPGFEAVRARKAPAFAFAACWLHAKSETAVKIRLNVEQSCLMYFDRKLLARRVGGFGLGQNPETIRVTLRPGPNLLLVKVATTGEAFGLRIRVTTTGDLQKAAPGVLVSAFPPRGTEGRVLLRETFEQGMGRFEGGTLADGGWNGSRALAVPPKGVWVEKPLPGPVTTKHVVRFLLKPLVDVSEAQVMFWSEKRQANHRYFVRNLRKDEWTRVEFSAVEARVGYDRQGPGMEGEVPDNILIYFDGAPPNARLLLDDFEIVSLE